MTTSASDTDSEAPSAATAQGTATTQVVFIDSRTPDIADLLAGLAPGEQAFVLDPTQDGLQQIAQILATDHLSDLSSISLVGHGASGQMLLGSTVLDEGDLGAHASDLAQIGAALSASGDLSLYGCDVAQGAQGREFIADLSQGLGGTDVAAATHLVGSADLGGSFALDASTGAPVGANPSPFTAQSLAAYEGVLATPQANAIQGDPDVFILSNSGGTHNQLQSAGDTGTYPATPATYFTDGSNEPGGVLNTNTTRVTLDPANNVYFLTVENDTGGATSVNKVVSGALSQLGSGTPSLTTLYSDNAPNQSNLDGSSEAANIEGLALDPVGKAAYFTEGDQFKSVSYSGGSASTLGTASGTPNYLIGLALDAPDHTAYFGAREEVITTVATAHGSKYTTTAQNALWKDANIQTPGQALSKLPLATGNGAGQLPGVIEDVALDPGRQYLYITTGSTAGSADGIYKYALTGNSSGAVTTVYSVPSTMEQTFGDIVVDAQGKYYVSVEINNTSGGIFVGSTSGGTPREFVQVPLASDGGGAEPIDAAVDLPPTLTLGSPNYSQALQGGPALQLMTGLPTASEPSGGDLAGATISLGGSYKSSDVLSVTAGGNITAFYNAGTLTLSGVDTVAHYEQVLESLTYQDTGTDASTGYHPTRTASVTLTDGLLTSAAVTQTVTIDRAPTAATHTASVAAGATTSASSAIDTDPDADTLTVTALTGGTVGAARAGTYGTLTLSANDTYSYAATNAAALASAPTGSHPTDSFTYTVSDGLGGTTSETLKFTIDRAPAVVNQSHALLASGAVTETAANGALASDTDPDGDTLTLAQVTPAGGAAMAVASSGTTTINGTYGALVIGADGHYTYTPGATGGEQSALAAVSGSHPIDTFALAIGDSGGPAVAAETLSFNIDRAPTATTHTVSLAAGASASASSAVDSDVDGDALTVTALSGGTPGTALAGTYGTLTLNANDTYSYAAGNASAIAAAPAGSHPIDSFTYTVSDGLGGTTSEMLRFTIDRAPLLGGLSSAVSYTQGASAVTLSAGATTSDPDGDMIGSATIAIAAAQAGDVLSAVVTGSSITASYNSTTGVLSLSGADTAAHYQQVLDSIAFSASMETAATYSPAVSRTISFQTTDALGLASLGGSETVNLNVVFADTAASVASKLDSLQANVASVSSITITDGAPLAITAAQDSSDAMALAKIAGPYMLDVTGVAGQPYTSFSQSFDAHKLLTSETLSGYSQATYGYASLVESFDTLGRVTQQTYETSSGATVQSNAITYNNDGTSSETVSGFTGEPYTSYTQSFSSTGQLTSETQSGYDMASYGYASVTDTYDSLGRITDQLYKTDTNTTQHEVMFAYSTSDNAYTETVTGVTGTDYTGYSQSFDTNGHLVGETLSGFPASYGYASVVDTFDSSGRVTSQAYEDSSGATERSVSLSYSTSDNSFTETVTGVTGQDYTGYSQSFDTNGHMSGETLSGYDMATFGYASVVETFDTMGRLTGQTFETNTNTVQHSVAIAYNSDSSHAVTYSGIQGQSFTGYTQDFDASNTLLAEQITNTDGSRTDDAFANDQTFASVSVNQSQNAVGTAETFVIAAGFAEVTINGYQPGQDSFDISSSLFADFNALIAHATPDGANATLITYDAQESFVILGATIAQLQSHSSDFHFV